MNWKKETKVEADAAKPTEITAEPATDVAKTEKDAKAQKPAPKKRSFKESLVRIGKGIAKWARDLRGEMKKVVWPSRKQVLNNTAVVLAVIAIFSITIWLFDLLFENVILKGIVEMVAGF